MRSGKAIRKAAKRVFGNPNSSKYRKAVNSFSRSTERNVNRVMPKSSHGFKTGSAMERSKAIEQMKAEGQARFKNMTKDEKALIKSRRRHEDKLVKRGQRVEKARVKNSKSTEWSEAKRMWSEGSEAGKKINEHIENGATLPKMGTAVNDAKETGSGMLKNIKDTGFVGGDYIGSAITGAAVGGTVSGVNEWSNGGSFWGGFKGGMINGAIGGAALKGVRVGAYGSNYARHGLMESTGKIAKDYSGHRMARKSKALQALERNKGASNIADEVMNKARRK